MGETISVIIPVYNVEKYLDRCIKSVIGSSYAALEIILVDDGSTDASGSMCDRYASEDKRIKVVHKENGGLSDARNVGIQVSTGSILTFIDSDDYISQDAIGLMYTAKCRYHAQISCCLFRIVDDKSISAAAVPAQAPAMTAFPCVDALEKMLRQSEIFCSASAKLYDRELFSDVFYPVGMLHEDLGTTYKLFAKAETVSLVRAEGYFYYTRPGSIQQSRFTKEKMVELKFAKEQKAYLDDKFPALRMATTDRLVSECFHILFSIKGSAEFTAERSEVERIIKENRSALLFARGTSKKTRFGCLLSYLGFGTEFWIYQKLGVRGKMIS